MGKNLVTENSSELLINAERDIASLKVLLSRKYYPEDFMYIPICFHATMAVEKLLKSYIISNGKEVEKSHDLNYLCETAAKINISFKKLENTCAIINDFVPGIKYGDEKQITKQDMNKIIKSLDSICDFPPIKAMRDSFSLKYKFQIIGEAKDTSN